MTQHAFKKEWFNKAPWWKIFLVKFLGRKTAIEEFDGKSICRVDGYCYKECLYITESTQREVDWSSYRDFLMVALTPNKKKNND